MDSFAICFCILLAWRREEGFGGALEHGGEISGQGGRPSPVSP